MDALANECQARQLYVIFSMRYRDGTPVQLFVQQCIANITCVAALTDLHVTVNKLKTQRQQIQSDLPKSSRGVCRSRLVKLEMSSGNGFYQRAWC